MPRHFQRRSFDYVCHLHREYNIEMHVSVDVLPEHKNEHCKRGLRIKDAESIFDDCDGLVNTCNHLGMRVSRSSPRTL